MARNSAARSPADGSNEIPAKRVLQCAIYARKSTEEGLQQEFNSLDAQREAGEAFIASQKQEGCPLRLQCSVFQSTPPTGAATGNAAMVGQSKWFQSTPPTGGIASMVGGCAGSADGTKVRSCSS
jgi:hypothetical protein